MICNSSTVRVLTVPLSHLAMLASHVALPPRATRSPGFAA